MRTKLKINIDEIDIPIHSYILKNTDAASRWEQAKKDFPENKLSFLIKNFDQAKLTEGTTMSATLDEHQNMIITIVDTDNKKTKKGKA